MSLPVQDVKTIAALAREVRDAVPGPERDAAVDRLTVAVQLALRAIGVDSGRVRVTLLKD